MKRLTALLLVAAMFLCLAACGKSKPNTNGTETATTTDGISTADNTEEKVSMSVNIEINGKSFKAELFDNETSRALLQKLPLTVNMTELNGNEKYYYLDSPLPADSQSVGKINAGDIMLFGSDCLVVFYESFTTSYSYTKIGRITDPSGLADAVGFDDVTVTFSLE